MNGPMPPDRAAAQDRTFLGVISIWSPRSLKGLHMLRVRPEWPPEPFGFKAPPDSAQIVWTVLWQSLSN